MANFNKAFDEIIGTEGGYTNNPNDKGGPTNWGITQKTLASFLGRAVSVEEVKSLTKEFAKTIYKRNYWDTLHLDLMESDFLAGLLFDQGVNFGVGKAAKRFQSAINALGSNLTVDGDIGPATRLKLNQYSELQVANEFIKASQDGYADIVAKDASQNVFIRGWINRSQAMMDKMITFALNKMGVSFKPPENVVVAEIGEVTKRQKVYNTALKEIGQKEIAGPKSNPRITEYHSATTLAAKSDEKSDEVAWCSAFVNWCMKQNGIKGTAKANARSFMDWGKDTASPLPGDVVVFWRGSKTGWQGHVAFYVDQTATHVKVLGGNQGNQVSMANYPKSQLLGFRTYA